MDFIAIDLETANSQLRSICQVGVVVFSAGAVVDQTSILVDPREPFGSMNIAIHGIEPEQVAGKPTFSDIHQELCDAFAGQIVVCHTLFDRMAIRQACEHHGLPLPDCRWLDSSRVARRAWPQFAKSGYGLASLAAHCGVSFKHHDATEDARTAGLVLARAITDSGVGLEDWIARLATNRKTQDYNARITLEGTEGGPLSGEVVVFTGRLSLPRSAAADLANSLGATVDPRVTKETTMVVVGDYDPVVIASSDISDKHQKALDLLSKGQPISILTEDDFRSIARI